VRCAVCGATVDGGVPLSWQCPRVARGDRRHVLAIDPDRPPLVATASDNPFLSYRSHLAVDRLGEGLGLVPARREQLIVAADEAVAAVAGTGFRKTPLRREDALSDALGFSADGGVWVKDETGNVAGSHKARHLFTILLHLLTVEEAGRAPWTRDSRPALAIASCGNAAIAASTLAASQRWPITVFVPVSASASVLALLDELGADVVACPRRDGDPPGDPCIHRFREAVAAGAIPFSVQGTENVWCLDGGRTLGWEIAESAGDRLDRVVIQVGGGAFLSSVGNSLVTAGIAPRLHAVQTEGCAPLARAWSHARRTGGVAGVGSRWGECMWPWESEPHSLADGILDDETYDWIGVLEAMERTGGHPVVAPEASVERAYAVARDLTAVDVSPTGTAGLAGLLAMLDGGEIAADESVAVVFSGRRR